MREGKHEKNKFRVVEKYSVLILIATLLMSIGYAEMTGITLSVTANAKLEVQDGVFITEVTRTGHDGADITNSKINSYAETTMNSTVVLGSSSSSTITYNVWLYNNSDKDHVFIDVIKDSMAYSNANITCSTDLVPYETVIGAGQNMDFNITFSYAGSNTTNNTLNSVLNFRFMEIPKLELSNAEAITNIYPGVSQEKIFTVKNFDGKGINGVPLDYTLVAEIYDESGNKVTAPMTATICNTNGTAVTSAVSMPGGEGASQTTHEYTLKLVWDSSNNSADYAGKTYSYKIKAVAVPNATATEKKYANYALTKETTAANITTAPFYFVTDPTSAETTSIEMADNKAAINLTVSNNDGKNYNVFETKYTIALDNTDFTLRIDGVEYANNITEARPLGTGELINIREGIELIPKTTSTTLTSEEICNLTITTTSPYAKTEVIKIIATDKTNPTKPEITGGSEEWATSRIISVSKEATDVGTGVKYYQYIVDSDGEAIATTATGNVENGTSHTFDTDYDGYYVYFRAVDAVGNVGAWSNSQQLNIDINVPVVSLVASGSDTQELGASYNVKDYFTYEVSGPASHTVTYTLNGNNISNLNEITEAGTYEIVCTVTKSTGTEDSETKIVVLEKKATVATDGSWNDDAGVNNPVLMDGMVAVYWSTDGGVTASTTAANATPIYSKVGGKSTGADNSAFNWDNWYDYVEGDNATDSKDSRWANAVTDDGSYWVWIPRFKYAISNKPATNGVSNAGKIDVKFIPTTDKKGASGYTTSTSGEILTKDSSGYIIHPAFENGSSTGKNNGFANGEWNKDLPGFWVAKYEMSMENGSGTAVTTSSSSVGNVKLSSTVKMVSKPGVSSWRYIQVGQIYQNCLLYDSAKNSHLIKNSEWGATAYLTHSQYGRNGKEITINNSSTYITGNAGGSVTAGSASGVTNAYNTTAGMLASTTGNIYGVYDMSGGAWEYTADWDAASKDEYGYLASYGKAKDGTVYFKAGGAGDQYKTAYSNGTTNNYYGASSQTYCKTGDGIRETWVTSSYSWFNDYSYFVYSYAPFSRRGGSYSNGAYAGVFSSSDNYGSAYFSNSFRAVLAGRRCVARCDPFALGPFNRHLLKMQIQ